MNWSAETLWWLAAGILVAAELATGTFNLLMLALGMAAGALAAHLGLGEAAQFVSAALVGGGAVILWRSQRGRRPAADAGAPDRNMNLDIGSQVHVGHWKADGTARVQYRGAAWDVRFQGTGAPVSGDYTIRGLDGNCLLVDQ